MSTKMTVQSWAVPLCAALFFLYEFFQMNMTNSLAPYLMQDFQVPAEALGILSSYYFWSTMLFLFPAGIILDHFPTKKVILTALTFCLAGVFLFSQTHSIALASFSRALEGVGSAFCFLSSIRLASRWLPANHMALAAGIIVTMAFIGGTLAQAPLTFLAQAVGWRNAIVLDGVVGIIIFIIIALVVRDYPADSTVKLQEQASHKQLGFLHSLQHAYLNWQNWLCGIYTNMMNLSVFVIGAIFGGIYLTQAHGLTADEAATISGFIFIGSLVGAPLSGWISDAMGKRLLPMRIGMILSLVVLAIILYIPGLSFTALLTLFFLLGLFTSAQIISYPLVAETCPPAITAMSISVISFNAISGGAIFQPFVGKLLDNQWLGQITNGVRIYPTSAYQYAFSVLTVGLILALIVTFFMKESNCKRVEVEK